MKVTISILSLLLSTASAANAMHGRDLQIGAIYAITYGSTVQDKTSGNNIVTTFTHSDVDNSENDASPAAYGAVEAKLYKVSDKACYDGVADSDPPACTCSTTTQVGTVTPGVSTTNDAISSDNIAQTKVTVSVAELLASTTDATTLTGATLDTAFVVYCVRLSLKTDDSPPLVANSQDVLVYFTGDNKINANFDVNAQPEGNSNGGTDIADFTVTARLCAGATSPGSSSTAPLAEGNDIAICIESNDDPAARIVDIMTWTWTYGTVSQLALDGGNPANDLTTDGGCIGTAPSKCEFTTLFGTAIYDAITADTTGTADVDGEGTVSMKFNGESRRARVLLSVGDNFLKDASIGATLAGRAAEEEVECTGFFLFCWITELLSCLF